MPTVKQKTDTGRISQTFLIKINTVCLNMSPKMLDSRAGTSKKLRDGNV
ncbi:hypothetical protein [Bacillus chungangensis]|uniref:Uncharacterized protein n=1 Tax=Bacillus chungangensis TaxID=587633 RepID=A0ABT9WNE1_9BACI|nr:hypothetical protein [Bacillus chungangensis]MDQ0174786.1 hypothetical protein [Bacillus chungangensis]